MSNITLFDTILKYFLEGNGDIPLSFANLEEYIVKFGDKITLNFYKYLIEKIDLDYKNSKERKENYVVKETYPRTLLTSIGPLTLSLTRYKNKKTGKSFSYTRDLLNILPYQRLTLFAEYKLVKNSIEHNMSQSARIAIRNYEVSRSLVSKLIRKLNGSIHENNPKEKNFVEVLYIEVDEIHANLQNKKRRKNEPPKNKICPVICVHEGYVNPNAKRKVKKNTHYFSSSKLSYKDLYDVVYEYIDSHYIINENVLIFISGDGGTGIKTYEYAFPLAIYVADRYHYKMKMKIIFKNDNNILKIADEYIRNDNIDAFKQLVDIQIEKYSDQKEKIDNANNYIINNIDAIKNQDHPLYKSPCSMEGTINSKYARYITSSPYAFSAKGLENKLKILTLRANKHELTFDDFIMLKYADDEQEEIINKINKLINIKSKINIKDKTTNSFVPTAKQFKLDDKTLDNYVTNLIRTRKEIKFLS